MRILTISAFYPPYVIGGAEICAHSLSRWFTDHGHDVAVLTTAPNPDVVSWGTPHEGYTLYRVPTAHIYPVFNASSAPDWQKPLWHLQDLFDPRNVATVDRVIEEFKPDFIHIHWIQGLGYNGLTAIARHDIPTAITLHDLAYVCVRTTMFRGGIECRGQCAGCRFSANTKMRYLKQIPRLGFISPSRANLDTVSALLPIADRPRFHILNPNLYPRPAVRHVPSPTARFLFVGRLEKTKGINFLIETLATLADRHDFSLTVLGKGPEAEALREIYGHLPWLTMVGHVPLQQVSDAMMASDLLLVPSLWRENSPGVVFQALACSLPVMGSDKGGLPELIEPGVNGFLVPSGDTTAWQRALTDVLDKPGQLDELRANAAASAGKFDYDLLANQMLDAFEVIRGQNRSE